MAGHEFLLPDELGWECNDEISKYIDKWTDKIWEYAQVITKEAGGSELKVLHALAKAELMDDVYAIIKKYQKKVKVTK